MEKQLEQITYQTISQYSHLVEPASQPNISLPPEERDLEEYLKKNTHSVGNNRVTIARAGDTDTASWIMDFCDERETDCIVICGDRVYLNGDSDAMENTRKKVNTYTKPYTLPVKIDGRCFLKPFISVPQEVDVNEIKGMVTTFANECAKGWYQNAMWSLQQQAGFHNYGYATITSLPSSLKQDAANLVQYLSAKTDLVNPIVMAGNPGDRTVIYMSADTPEGKMMADKYAACMSPNSAPHVNAFVLYGEHKVEAFLNDANEAGLHAHKMRIDDYVKWLGVGPNAMVQTSLDEQSDKIVVLVNANSEIGKYLAAQYSQNISVYGFSTNEFVFDSQKEADDFVQAGEHFLEQQDKDELGTIDDDAIDAR